MRSRPARKHPLLAAAVVFLAACGGDDRGGDAWTTTYDILPDGAVLVENRPPAGGIEPTWILEEELRIGSVGGSGPATFGQIRGLAPLDDGRIAVLDAQAQEIRLFGSDGHHLATFGGQGQGPGEMEAAFGLMRGPEGMLWVPDHRNARMSVFDPDAGFDRSYRLDVLSRAFVWRGLMTLDGRIVKPSITLEPRRQILRLYDLEMNLVDSLPAPQGPELSEDERPHVFSWGSRDAGAWGFYNVPYFPRGEHLLDPRGTVWSTEFGDPSYRITRWTFPGDTTLVLETRRDPVPVTRAERDSVIDEVREVLRERGAADQDWSKIPDVKPAVLGMFAAEDGKLWVQVASPDTLLTYDVYERTGEYAGTAVGGLHVFPPIQPMVRGDRFWAVVTDRLDVPYVVRARLRPADGSAFRAEQGAG